MAGLLKNQILKPLSRFVKNLSPDKIKISAIKGEGDLTNLELDEEAIMELLDLPTWLLLNKVTCNKVSIKIQWTRIKSQPICVLIDKVFVEIEVLEEPRPLNSGPVPSYRSNSGKYGLIDRVIDGIKVSINSVKIVLKAAAFKASLELSRLVVASKLPNWKDAELKFTNIRDSSRNSILLFKEIYWETTRIEADALQNLQVTPVKLITNTSRIRITLKKRLSDCAILTSRVQLLLDDLLWVLTVSQMEAAVLFLKSLQSSILKSSQQSKAQAEEKIKRQVGNCDGQTAASSSFQPSSSSSLHPSSAASQANQTVRNSNLRRLFDYYDVQETSYHLYTGRVELHFCEEGQEDTGLSKHSVKSGAIRVVLSKINLDFYPFHNQTVDRSLWSAYADFGKSRDEWLTKLRKHQAFIANCGQNPLYVQQGVPARVLMESVFVLRLNEVQMGCVSTPNIRKPHDFLGSDRAVLNLPPDTNTLFLDYTEYYYSDNSTFQVPAALLYCQANPFHLRLDLDTLVWLNAFYLNLNENLEQLISSAEFSESTTNAIAPELLYRVEATLPRIILPPEAEVIGQPERPDLFQLQASSVVLSNILPSETTKQDRHALHNTLEKLYNPKNSAFFRDRPDHEAHIDWKYFESSVSSAREVNYLTSRTKSTPDTLLRIQLNQLWLEFVNSNGSFVLQPHTEICLDSMDISLWLLIPTADTAHNTTTSVLVDYADPPAIRLNHYQLLYMYRLMESLAKMGEHISEDSLAIISRCKPNAAPPPASNIALAYNLPAGLSMTFAMPAAPDNQGATAAAARETENDTPGSLFQFVKENATITDPLESVQTFVTSSNSKLIGRASSSIPLVSEENCSTTMSSADAPLLMSSVNHSDTELNTYYNNKEMMNPSVTSNAFTSNCRYSQSTNQLSPPVISSSNNTSPRISSPVMRSGRRTPTGTGLSGTFNQSVNRLGSTFSKFGGKLKATMTTSSGNSSNYGDEDASEDWEHLSMAGSEFSDSDDERLIAMMTADLELDQGYAPGGVAQGVMHPISRPGSAQPGQYTIEIGGDARCLMDGEESCISSLASRTKNMTTVAFLLSNVKLYLSSTSLISKLSLTVGSCAVEESLRSPTLESCSDLASKKQTSNLESLDSVDLIIVSCDIPVVPLGESDKSKYPVSQTEVHLNRELSLNLLMSSLVNLADLFEDEILPPGDIPFPILRIILEHPVCLSLIEDRACTNLTCPGDHQKIFLRLRPGMQLLRDTDGVLEFLPPAAAATLSKEMSEPILTASVDELPINETISIKSEFSSLNLDAGSVMLDNLTVVSCGVNNRRGDFTKSQLSTPPIPPPVMCSVASQTVASCENKELIEMPPAELKVRAVSLISASIQCNLVSSSPTSASSEVTISSSSCVASAGNFSTLTPSQELLAHYYTENVKLREKITSLRRERGHLAEQLAGCRQALEDSAREKQLLSSHSSYRSSNFDYRLNSSSASMMPSSSVVSPPSNSVNALNHSQFIPSSSLDSATKFLDSSSNTIIGSGPSSSSATTKLAAKKAIL